jgi:EAL domain-containing protein (putative c-di-GMP-specific phosphodiesterase class I)
VERLKSLGCRLGQGYYFAKPMDPEMVTAMLTSSGEAGYHISGDQRPN